MKRASVENDDGWIRTSHALPNKIIAQCTRDIYSRHFRDIVINIVANTVASIVARLSCVISYTNGTTSTAFSWITGSWSRLERSVSTSIASSSRAIFRSRWSCSRWYRARYSFSSSRKYNWSWRLSGLKVDSLAGRCKLLLLAARYASA